MPRCWIALGGNLGDVRTTLADALSSLNRPGMQVVRGSRLYDTTPISARGGGRYLNAAAELEVALSPEEVLDGLQSIETAAGRERRQRWDSRILDLDLLLYEDVVCETTRLTLPHPALWYRRFVLDPLAEIAPDVVHPQFGLPVGTLKSRLHEQPLPVGLLGDTGRTDTIRRRLDDRFAHQIRWVGEPRKAAIVFRRGEQERLPIPGCPQVIELPDSDEAIVLAQLILTAALDEPIPVD